MDQRQIAFINPAQDLVAFTDGSDAKLSEIKGSPRPKALVDMDTMAVTGNNVDQDCPGGVCPIK